MSCEAGCVFCALGVAGCRHPDLLLLRSGLGFSDRARQLQPLQQQRVQVRPILGCPAWVVLFPCRTYNIYHVLGRVRYDTDTSNRVESTFCHSLCNANNMRPNDVNV